MLDKITLVKPRGFCAGVERAIQTVEEALKKFGAPIYVRHAIVHNEHVISDLEKKGAIFVEDLSEIPDGSTVVLSAHGSPPDIHEEATERFQVIDATCPLVMKVHFEAKRYHDRGYKIILIGKEGHQEVIGTMGYAPMTLIQSPDDIDDLSFSDDEKIVCLTQTTLSLDDTKEIIDTLKSRYPSIQFPPKEDICYATQNRQNAVRELVKDVDHVFVMGSEMSSNSKQLVRTAKNVGVDAHLISNISQSDLLSPEIKNLGVTSGASVPEEFVQELISHLRDKFGDIVVDEIVVTEETMKFPLPKEL
jgi:4-hydroxy-3-methylbut-2-enyl diphosphate reductase